MTALSPDALSRMRALWEGSPELTAAAIGERFGVSKSAVIGQADRRRWRPRGAPPGPVTSTLFQRLDAINARMDAVIEETRAAVAADRAKRSAAKVAA